MNPRPLFSRLVALTTIILGVGIAGTQVNAVTGESQHKDINNSINPQLLAQQGNVNENKLVRGVLHGCIRSGSSVKCSVAVISSEDFQHFAYCKADNITRLFDKFGNVYPCSQIQIGDQKNEGGLSSRFPQETPVKATLTFNNIPAQTSEFDTLELHIQFIGFVKFKNIKVK
jgi:hypothetical protein